MERAASVFLPVGSGPRSIAFSDDGSHVYVTCELSNEIAVLQWEKEEKRISVQQMISSLPENDGNGEKTQSSTVGGIVLSPDGRYLTNDFLNIYICICSNFSHYHNNSCSRACLASYTAHWILFVKIIRIMKRSGSELHIQGFGKTI